MSGLRARSSIHAKYILRLVVRVIVAGVAVCLYICDRADFAVIKGAGFFYRFSVLHLLWLMWLMDMILQLVPARRYMALGSQKQFARFERAVDPAPPADALREFIRGANRGAAKVLALWLGVVLVLGIRYFTGILGAEELLLCAAFFYVCDLICVLVWCPFRALLMKNRCCTTCRIFNWDHLMMFSPLVFVPGVYTYSLVAIAAAVFLLWEVQFHRHPERFWARSNGALQCAQCTDKLCPVRIGAPRRREHTAAIK